MFLNLRLTSIHHLSWLLIAVVTASPAFAEEPVGYNRDVRPILAANCFTCHGFDATAREADLRLDAFEHATAPRKQTAAIVPGEPEASGIIQRITHDDPREVMPPPDTGHVVSDEQVAILKQWIAEGANYEDHWSFITPTRPALPEVSNPEWVQNPIDAFVMAKLDEADLRPSEPANKRTLIRRVSFDLTGLPPTPEEVEAFVADESPDAYERLVDRLLNSPRYGEHMARFWLDAARYADTHGYQYDLSRTMWPWREWVINAYNENMPFDQFTIEQLAGDLLPNATESQKLASGFNRNHPITIEGGIIDQEYITEYVMDRVETTSTVWMGLTMGCARCHDHKFDPVTMDDFYSFYAFFNQVPERGHGSQNQFKPTMQVTPPMQRGRLQELERELAELQGQRDELLQDKSQREQWRTSLANRVKAWQQAEPVSVNSTADTKFKTLDDGSVLANGPAPDKETYEVLLHVEGPVAAVRLEALTHESLPDGSVGRAFNGNFVLTRFEAAAAPMGTEDFTEVAIASASADYEQDGYPVAGAIAGSGGKGWAIDGNTRRENSTAVFTFDEPIEHSEGTTLRLRMVHDWGSTHAIGRFRLSTVEDVPTDVPASTLALLQADPETLSAEQRVDLDTYLLSAFGTDAERDLVQQLYSLRGEYQQVAEQRPTVMIMADHAERKPTYVLEQGIYDGANKDRPVSPRTPDALPAIPDDQPKNRLGLARWLVSDEQPLTARVQVNRLWQQMFGTGIVETAGDFGTQGEWPTHQGLLDWMAVEFVDSGWDVKHMMRTIVMSATYQQSSRIRSEMLDADPRNRLLARGPRHRLGAEVVRDNALAVSGLLSDKMGGPSVYPYQQQGLWEETNNRPGLMEEYVLSKGEDLYRRSLYTFWKRSVLAPTMQAFDAPSREVCSVQRSRTNTPLQALALMNDPQFIEAARFLAERMIHEGEPSFEGRVTRGFKLAVGRRPTSRELDVLRDLYAQQLQRYERDHEAARKTISVGKGARDDDIEPVFHAAWTTIARTILNLDETITKE
ncbi:MAG: PSD1 and planctomycete cytochrome C domain-containing protein [Phycisphaeraceae bacterium]